MKGEGEGAAGQRWRPLARILALKWPCGLYAPARTCMRGPCAPKTRAKGSEMHQVWGRWGAAELGACSLVCGARARHHKETNGRVRAEPANTQTAATESSKGGGKQQNCALFAVPGSGGFCKLAAVLCAVHM